MDRRAFIGAASAAAVSAPGMVLAANQVFTDKYQVLRKRFTNFFEFGGQVAESANDKARHFGDQTLYLGFAMLTFAGEARLLARANADPRPAEKLVRSFLNAFDLCDKDAERERYKTQVGGFFLRDYVRSLPNVNVSSDFLDSAAKAGQADMSIDQVVSMMMGWWAVAHWSTDKENQKIAREQAGRVMDFLMRERFMIERPGTSKLVSRGEDARAAAGFLCQMGEDITGQDYYNKAKVRMAHDNRCHTCAGTGEVNVPDPNVQCTACSGSGKLKVVVGGGRCAACRGTGDVRISTESKCPACSGSGEIRIVATDFFGKDHTVGKDKCRVCGGDGKVGGKTQLGKCRVCGGDGKLPSITKDLGKCKICNGVGRIKATLPKVKCPVCGGSKELNFYVRVTHPIILGLEPVGLAALHTPRIGLHGKKLTIDFGNRKLAKSFVRHMNLVCLAFEDDVPDAALLVAAKDSNHPWSVALRAAIKGGFCPTCRGKGHIFVNTPDVSSHGLHSNPTFRKHDLGTCKTCGGKGFAIGANSSSAALRAVLDQLVSLHKQCPLTGPQDKSASPEWVKDNRWVRCTDLRASSGDSRYNGLDFLSLEVLLRLAGAGDKLKG